MKLSLLQPFEHLPYFTFRGFLQMLEGGEAVEQRTRELLSRWRQAGHILALKRGVYMTRRFYEAHRGEADFSAAVSAILLPQSYVSLEYVLQQAGILSEATYPVTAITTKNTRFIQNSIGVFDFRHIKSQLYGGFRQGSYHNVIFHRASWAKALFDYLYLRPLPRRLRTHQLDFAEDLRLNLDEFSTEARDEFEAYIEAGASPKMSFLLENLRRTVWRP